MDKGYVGFVCLIGTMVIASVIAVALYLAQVEETQKITGVVMESTTQSYVYPKRQSTTSEQWLRRG